MATAEELLRIVGSPVDSLAVRSLVIADALVASATPDFEEGEPQRSYLSNPAAGYQLIHAVGRVVTAFLYAEPAEGFVAFSGSLPGGLSRGATRAQVREQFDTPERSGEPYTSPILGRQGAWDRFAVGSIRVHFQYTDPEQRVRLVTIMPAADAP